MAVAWVKGGCAPADNRHVAKEIDYYAVLHVRPDAPPEIIRASYRVLMQQLGAHPDLGGDHGYAQLINEAYAVLKDPGRRRAYDKARQAMAARPPESAKPEEPAPESTSDTGLYRMFAETGTWSDTTGLFVRVLDRCAFCDQDVPTDMSHSVTHCRVCAGPLTVAERHRHEASARRSVHRICKDEPVRLRADWRRPDTLEGRLLDISLRGMRVWVGVRLAEAQNVFVDCANCEAVGRVAYCRPATGDDRGGFTVGLEFVTLEFKRRKGSLFTAPA